MLTSLGSVLAMAWVLKLERAHAVSFLPKSVTTAIGMDVAEKLGGAAALAGADILLTGLGDVFRVSLTGPGAEHVHGRIDHDAAQPAPDGSGRTHVGGAGDGFEGAFLDHIHGIIRIFNIGIGQAIQRFVGRQKLGFHLLLHRGRAHGASFPLPS